MKLVLGLAAAMFAAVLMAIGLAAAMFAAVLMAMTASSAAYAPEAGYFGPSEVSCKSVKAERFSVFGSGRAFCVSS